MAYYRMKKELQDKYNELLKSKEWTDVVSKYMLLRCSEKKTDTKEERIDIATKFVRANIGKFPSKYKFEDLVNKISRKLSDSLEKDIQPLMKKLKTGKVLYGNTEKPAQALTPEQIDAKLVEGLEVRNVQLARIGDGIEALCTLVKDAFFVKEGDINDKETKKSKYVGCSWLHALRQEVAQLRGIAGKESVYTKEDDKNGSKEIKEVQIVPVVVPPTYSAPPHPAPWVQEPSTPTPYRPYELTCSNSNENADQRLAGSVK